MRLFALHVVRLVLCSCLCLGLVTAERTAASSGEPASRGLEASRREQSGRTRLSRALPPLAGIVGGLHDEDPDGDDVSDNEGKVGNRLTAAGCHLAAKLKTKRVQCKYKEVPDQGKMSDKEYDKLMSEALRVRAESTLDCYRKCSQGFHCEKDTTSPSGKNKKGGYCTGQRAKTWKPQKPGQWEQAMAGLMGNKLESM